MNSRRWITLGAAALVIITALVVGVRYRPNRLFQRQSNGQTSTRFTVVATTFPLYDFTRAITENAEGVRVEPLLPLNVGPHDFAPTPETASLVASANIIVRNGLDFDPYLDKLMAASGNTKAVIVDTSLGVTKLSVGEAATDPEHAYDPHIWLDPANANIMVQHIRDALIKADPRNKLIYEGNAGHYITRLNQLNQNYTQTLSSLPNKQFVAFHSAWRYLATRFGLTEVAVLEPTPGKEPTAKELVTITAAIRQTKVKAIFSEPQFSPRLVETVAKDLGLQVLSLDPLETAAEGDTYLVTMRRNLETLRHGLQQ